jgi:hypothetical protein
MKSTIIYITWHRPITAYRIESDSHPYPAQMWSLAIYQEVCFIRIREDFTPLLCH